MRYSWLDKYAEDGLIRKEVLADIYKDVRALIKEGEEGKIYKLHQPPKTFGERSQDLLWASGIGALLGWAGSKYTQHADESAGRQRILDTRAAMLRQGIFHGKEEEAAALFNEVATYAPHVAMNLPLVKKLVHAHLDTGLSDEDIMQLALLQAHHMPDVMRQPNYLPKTASVNPAALGEMAADMFILAKTASLASVAAKAKAFFKGTVPEARTKTTNFFTNMAMLSGASLAVAAMSGVTNAALHKIDKRKLDERLNESFSRALALETIYSEPLRANKDQARLAFSALSHFAPHVALEPQAANAFMGNIVAYNHGVQLDQIRALSDIQRNADGSSVSPMQEGFMGAHKAFDMGSILGDALSESAGRRPPRGGFAHKRDDLRK